MSIIVRFDYSKANCSKRYYVSLSDSNYDDYMLYLMGVNSNMNLLGGIDLSELQYKTFRVSLIYNFVVFGRHNDVELSNAKLYDKEGLINLMCYPVDAYEVLNSISEGELTLLAHKRLSKNVAMLDDVFMVWGGQRASYNIGNRMKLVILPDKTYFEDNNGNVLTENDVVKLGLKDTK